MLNHFFHVKCLERHLVLEGLKQEGGKFDASLEEGWDMV